MYFNVNFNAFFKLIKVHLLVSELYIFQNARCNDKKNFKSNVFAQFYISKYFGIYEWEFIKVRLIEWTCRQFERQCRLLAACRANSYTLSSLLFISVYMAGEVQKLLFVVKISLQGQFLIYRFVSGRHK